VQRGNPEIQRRAQEVIDRCWALGDDNPIMLIHDVGAGGLSNALPEVIDHSGLGGRIELRDVPNDEPGMSPMEIWCNEAQERYVLAVAADRLDVLRDLRARALPLGGGRRDHRRAPPAGDSDRCSATRRSTCRSRCCSASRRA
jgi:phosphoribosylformylglycinamidine synthase